jgi:hypothetical protein
LFRREGEVEETNLGMWMTKKREEDNTPCDLYRTVRLAWADEWKFGPDIRLLLSVARTRFFRKISTGDLTNFKILRTGPPSVNAQTPVNNVIVFANLSQISPLPNPAVPLIVPREIFLMPLPISSSQSTVIPPRHSHARPVTHTPDGQNAAWTHATRLHRAVGAALDVRRVLGPRCASSSSSSLLPLACSLDHPLVRRARRK